MEQLPGNGSENGADRSSGYLTRRDALGLVGLGLAAAPVLLSAPRIGFASPDEKAVEPVEYTLPPLPYAYDALDSFLSREILELHHDKHHAGYVKGLNGTLAALAEARSAGNLAAVKGLSRALAFHGSGHVLHTIYWNSMNPKGGGVPKGLVADALTRSFGSFDAFKAHFAAATKAAEASGWGILAWEPMGHRLIILAAESHQQMGVHGCMPLMVCDVWEHAYYLRYQNRRGDYVDGFFDVLNWTFVEERLRAAIG